MKRKRIVATLIFLVGALLGSSSKSDIWNKFHSWTWIIVLLIAILICNIAAGMWRSSGKRNELR